MLTAGPEVRIATLVVSMPALRRMLVMLTEVWNGAKPWSDTTMTLLSRPAASAMCFTALSAV